MSIRNTLDSAIRKFEKDFATHNRIEISSAAILRNLDLFTNLTGMAAMPVLKANAYGHGISLVSTVLKQRKVPYIAVDGYFEALRVREATNQPVLIMGSIRLENYSRLHYDNFAFVVHDDAAVRALAATRK